MAALGLILIVVGVMALLGSLVQKLRAGRLGDTPHVQTGQVASQGRALASPKGAISTQGQIQTQQVLTSPVSGAPCVYFKMKLETEWAADGVENKYTVVEDAQAVPFAVNDGSGHAVVSIDAKRGGEFCSQKPFERKKFSRGLIASMTQKPLEVTPTFSIPPNVQVRNAIGRMIDVPVTANFFVSEEFLEPKGPLFINGKLQEDGSIGSPNWTSLLILNKSRDELLSSTAGFARKLFYTGGIVTPIGVIISVIAELTAPPKPPPAPTPAVMAPVAAPAPAVMAPTGPIAHSLVLGGGCAALDLAHGLQRVNTGGDGVNVIVLQGATLHRVFVKLGSVTPGQTVNVCTIGRRCQQNIQVSVGGTTFINTGSGVGGTITVTDYDVAAGRMNITFNGVSLPLNQGAGLCTISGSLSTTGITQ